MKQLTIGLLAFLLAADPPKQPQRLLPLYRLAFDQWLDADRRLCFVEGVPGTFRKDGRLLGPPQLARRWDRECRYIGTQHMFTTDPGERDLLRSNGWKLEGVTAYVQVDGQ